MAKKPQRSKIGKLVDKFNQRLEPHTHVYLEVSHKDVHYRLKVRKNLWVPGEWNEEKQEVNNAGLDVLLNDIECELRDFHSLTKVLVMLGLGEIEQFQAIPKNGSKQNFIIVVDAFNSYINAKLDIPTSPELWHWIQGKEWQFFSGFCVEKAQKEKEGIEIRRGNVIIPVAYGTFRQMCSRKIGLRKPDLPEVKVIKSEVVTF